MPAGYKFIILNLHDTYSREGRNECVQRSRKRASEEKFKAIFDNTSDAIVLCDDHGCCTDINEATRRIPGYEIDDLGGVCIEEFLVIPEEMDFDVVWKNFLNGEILNGLMNIRKKDGALITGSFNAKSNMRGNYKFVSESCLPILGIEPDYLVGKNAFERIHPEDRKLYWHCF